ncbi:MAG TPA: ABC transporter ATP-binding protein [Propionicimonas sp.]|nr:ABC transporter ATP-binding protein [Propionicimonas sp.]
MPSSTRSVQGRNTSNLQHTSTTTAPRAVWALWKMLTNGQKAILILVSLGNTIAAIAIVLPSLIIGQMVTTLTSDKTSPVTGLVVELSTLLALFVIIRVLIHIFLHRVLPHVEATLREAQLRHTLMTPIATGGDVNEYAAEQNSLMGKGAKAGADAVKIVFADLMPAAMQAVVAAIAAFNAQWQVGLVLLAAGVGSTLITQFQLRSQGGVRVAINRAKARLDGLTTELLRGKAVIRTLNATGSESARVGANAFELSAVEVRHHKMMGWFDAAKTTMESFFAVVVLIIAAGFVAAGANPGLVLTLYLLFMQFAAPLRDIHRIRDELNECTVQLVEVFSILEQPVDDVFVRPATAAQATDQGVSINRVSVRYGASDLVVREVSVEVPSGTYLGICGPAGCGKSTLVKALVGIMPVASGQISIGGVSVDSMSAEQLTAEIAYVSQEPYVVSGTIRENLLLGQSSPISDDELDAVLGRVGLRDEIAGLDTAVGEDGKGLSGGQKQRLVLARVMLRPAAVIVLDEATSALDNLNEELFMRALESSKRTVIAIAHRLSTVRKADQIIVMEAGRIVESGTFGTLDQQRGLFHQLLHAGD